MYFEELIIRITAFIKLNIIAITLLYKNSFLSLEWSDRTIKRFPFDLQLSFAKNILNKF